MKFSTIENAREELQNLETEIQQILLLRIVDMNIYIITFPYI